MHSRILLALCCCVVSSGLTWYATSATPPDTILVDTMEANNKILRQQLDKISYQVPYEVQQADIYKLDMDAAWQQHLWDKCVEYKMSKHYELMLAIVWQESNFNPDLISETNDYGLMQINQCNHTYLSETFGITDFLDPYQSIDAGVIVMSSLLRRYEGNEHKALMAYNAGPTGARKMWSRGDYSSRYSREVMKKKQYIYSNK